MSRMAAGGGSFTPVQSNRRPAITTAPEEDQEPGIPQPLQLLPEFGADILVAWIANLKFRFESVKRVQAELRPQALDAAERIHQPSPGGQIALDRAGTAHALNHMVSWQNHPASNHGDPPGHGDISQADIATDPTGALGMRGAGAG